MRARTVTIAITAQNKAGRAASAHDEASGWPIFAHEVKVAVRLNDHFIQT
jgi:hypothetical protein